MIMEIYCSYVVQACLSKSVQLANPVMVKHLPSLISQEGLEEI